MRIKIKDNWSEVTLKEYQDISELNGIDMDEINRQIKIVSILSKFSEDEIEAFPLPTLKAAIRATDFLYTTPEPMPLKNIWIKGKRYRVNLRLNELTGGEYIDLTGYTKDAKEITGNLHHLIALFLHPVNFFGFRKGKYYKGGSRPLNVRNEIAKSLPDNIKMDVVFRLSGFFLPNFQALLKATLDCSVTELLKTKKKLMRMKKQMKHSKSTGDGF